MPVEEPEAIRILTGLGCEVARAAQDPHDWKVGIPSFRMDLSIKQDLAEEIARTLGYDRIRETVAGAPVVAREPVGERRPAADRSGRYRLAMKEGKGPCRGPELWLPQARPGFRGSGLSSRSAADQPCSARSTRCWFLRCCRGWFEIRSTAGIIISAPSRLRSGYSSCAPPSGPKLADRFKPKARWSIGVEESWKLSFALSGPRLAGGLRNERGEVDFHDVKAVVENLDEGAWCQGRQICGTA